MPAGAVPLWQTWAWTLGGLALSVVLALIGHALLYRILGRIARRSATPVDNALVDRTCGPTRLLFPLLAFSASLDEITTRVPRLWTGSPGCRRRRHPGGGVDHPRLHTRGARHHRRPVPDRRRRQPRGPPHPNPGRAAAADRRGPGRGRDAGRRAHDLSQRAPGGPEPLRLGRGRGAGRRHRCAAGARQHDRGHSNRAVAADPARRHRGGGGRVRPGRGDQHHLRGDPNLGRAPHGGAAHVLHREAFHQLDPHRQRPHDAGVLIYADYRIDVESVRAELGRIVRTTNCGTGGSPTSRSPTPPTARSSCGRWSAPGARRPPGTSGPTCGSGWSRFSGPTRRRFRWCGPRSRMSPTDRSAGALGANETRRPWRRRAAPPAACRLPEDVLTSRPSDERAATEPAR